MFNYLKTIIKGSNLESFMLEVEKLSNAEFAKKNGNKSKWQNALNSLKSIEKVNLSQKDEYIFIDSLVDEKIFAEFKPWRKGPFAFQNFNLDSEWNGNLKWQRLEKHLDFENKLVLDVGCGNGYFAYCMALKKAKLVLGLEPFLLFNYQFYATQSLIKNTQHLSLAPLKLEQVPDCPQFDIVFSMGVLYHSKSPIEHILKLKKMLGNCGKLILETLIVDGEDGYSLMPKDRYAKMRNVWFIPSTQTLIAWVKRCGFTSVEIIDDSITTTTEQRKTSWIGENSASLEDFIDDDKTVEGYSRPRRLMLLCNI